MTPIEKRNAFLYGILTNTWLSLNHAIGLVGGESAKIFHFDDKEGCRLVIKAYEAVEAAKHHFELKSDKQTVWDEERKEDIEKRDDI